MSRRLLIVDDHSPTRDVLTRLFATRGWAVRCAADLAGALSEAAGGPDCILLDLSLPDGEGEAVLDATADLPIRVVVQTGISDPIRLNGIADRYPLVVVLHKPFDPADLYRACEDGMDGLRAG